MTPLHQRHSSFVLRIWWEEADAAAGNLPVWRGWVQHVRSGEAAYVQDMAGLLAFIERWAGRLSDEETPTRRLR